MAVWGQLCQVEYPRDDGSLVSYETGRGPVAVQRNKRWACPRLSTSKDGYPRSSQQSHPVYPSKPVWSAIDLFILFLHGDSTEVIGLPRIFGVMSWANLRPPTRLYGRILISHHWGQPWGRLNPHDNQWWSAVFDKCQFSSKPFYLESHFGMNLRSLVLEQP